MDTVNSGVKVSPYDTTSINESKFKLVEVVWININIDHR